VPQQSVSGVAAATATVQGARRALPQTVTSLVRQEASSLEVSFAGKSQKTYLLNTPCRPLTQKIVCDRIELSAVRRRQR